MTKPRTRRKPTHVPAENAEQKPSEVIADPDRQLNPDLTDKASAKRMALCVSCQLRETCDRLMPPGGVWHCIDYC
jgi:hypothetical protein